MSTTTLTNDQTLDNATIPLGTTDVIANNTNIYLAGTLTNAGTLFEGSTGNLTGIILDSPTVMLEGGGILLLSDNADNRLFGNGASTGVLINIDNTIEGAGQIGINAGGQSIALTNEVAGVIDATGVNNALVIQTGGPSLANDGLIEATAMGGLVVYQTTIDQTGGGTILASGGDVFLQGLADIVGGVLRATLGSDIQINDGPAALGGPSASQALTIAADTTVQLDNNNGLDLYGTLDDLGTLAADSTGNVTQITVAGATVELTGGGTLLFSDENANEIFGGGSGLGTLINLDDTITGAGEIGNNDSGAALSLTNEVAGVIDASGVNNALIIQTGGATLANDGLIEATGSGGLIVNQTTIDQTGGGTILASAAGDVFLQNGADILGGVLRATLGADIQIDGGTATLGGPGAIPALTIAAATTVQVDNNNALDLYGTLDDLGTLEADSTVNVTQIIVAGPTVDLTGGGTLLLSDEHDNEIFGGGSGLGTLVNLDDTITGGGQIGVNAGGQAVALTNEVAGVIDASAVNNALVIATGGPSLVNSGLIEATGAGSLIISNTVIDQTGGGTILANGAIVQLQPNAQILGGLLLATAGGEIILDAGGTAYLGGPMSPAAITIGSATTVQVDNNQELDLYGTLDNLGTLAAASTGNVTDIVLAGPTVVLTGGGTVLFSDGNNNRIFGAGSGLGTLINLDNTIAGGGQIGLNTSGQPIALTNATSGVIDASAANNALVIQTGGPTLVNDGLIEATGSGGLVIVNSVIDQTGGGTILASGAGDVNFFPNAEILGGLLLGVGGGEFFLDAGGTAYLGGPSTSAALTIGTATTVQVDNNQQLDLYGTLDNLGTLAAASTGNSTDIVIAGPTVMLTGGGTVLLSDNGNNRIYGGGSGLGTLINLDNTIAGAGQLGIGNGGLAPSLTNDGVIDATGGNALVINTGGPALINNALMEATGSGGLVIDSSVIDQTGGGTILATGSGNVYIQNNADILGGLLLGTLGGEFFINTGGDETLGGPTTTAAITIGTATTVQVDNNQLLELYGTIVNHGTLADDSTGNSTDIVMEGPVVTLTGSGTVLLSDNANNRIYGGGTGFGGMLNLDNTIEGAGQIGINNDNLPLSLTNDAVIDADESDGTALVIDTGGPALTNNALLEATNGGDLAIGNTTIANRFGTILAGGGGVNLNNADIIGGVLIASAGGLFTDASSTTLDGSTTALTIAADTVFQDANNQYLYLAGTLDNRGTLFDGGTGNDTDIILNSPTVVLTGSGTLLLSDNGNNRIYGGASSFGTLINLDNTIQGAGQLGDNNDNYPLALTNDAVIDADESDGTALVIQTGGPALINNALMEATGSGNLTILNTTIDNGAGTILAGGGAVILNNADIIGGLLIASSGGLFTDVSSSTLDGGTTALTIAADTTFAEANNQYLYLAGTLENVGTLFDDATNNDTDIVLNSPTVVLTGSGTLLLSDNSHNRIYGGASSFGTLINLNNTIEGAGQLGDNNGNFPLALTNDGVIDADESDGTGLVVQTGGPALINNAVLEATGAGVLSIVNTTIDNAAGTILVGSGAVDLSNADIVGGTLISTGGGLFTAAGGTTLDGTTTALTIAADTDVQEANNQYMYIAGTIDNAGTLSIDSTGNNTDLVLDSPTVVLTGGGTLFSDSHVNDIYGQASSLATLINLDNTIDGGGNIGISSGNNPVTLINDGVIDANLSGEFLQIATGGPTVVNAGLLEATESPGLSVYATTITNSATGTIAAYDGGLVDFTGSSDVLNEVGNTLTGGEYAAYAGGVMELLGSGPLAVDAANIILSGTGSEIYFGDDVSFNYTTIESSLTEVSGTLQIDDGKTYSTSNILTVDAGGHLDLAAGTLVPAEVANAGTIFGYGVITYPSSNIFGNTILNTGVIEADGGTLIAASGYISGSGSIVIDSGAAFELGTVVGGEPILREQVMFAPAVAIAGSLVGDKLIIEGLPYGFQGVLTSLSPGDTIDLADATATSATIIGTTLVISLSDGGGTFDYSLSSANPLDRPVTSPDGAGGTDINIYGEAVAGTLQPVTKNFGDLHVGAAANEMLTLSNIATFANYAEDLDATMAAAGAGLTTGGSITGLAPGDTNSTSLTAGLLTTTAGAKSGTATADLFTDGTSIPGDGLGPLAIGTQSVSLSATVFNYATGSISPVPLALGEHHVASTITGFVTLANTAPAGLYSENLDAGLSGTSADLTALGTVSELAAGSLNSSALAVTLHSGAAGLQTGTVAISLVSDGAGIDTLGTTGLGTVVETVTGTLYNYATASSVTPDPVSLGQGHVAASLTKLLTISNVAATGGFSEGLDVSLTGTSSDLLTNGSLTTLAAGAANSSALSVTLVNGTAGAFTGTSTIDLTSDGAGIDTLAATGLAAQTLTVTGTLFNEATASAIAPVDFGIVHVGGAATGFVTIANSAASGLFSENLDASFASASGSFTAAGTLSTLAAGAQNSTALTIALDTEAAGTIAGAATIGLVSDGAGIDTLGATSLGFETIVVTGTVDNYATAAIATVSGAAALTGGGTSYELNFGDIGVGTTHAESLQILNDAAGPADLLAGSFAVFNAAPDFDNLGFTSFTSIAAGGADTGLTIDLGGTTLGQFSETIVLSPTGFNASGYSGTLALETLFVTGDIMPCFAAGTRILGLAGEIPVEAVRPGDIMVTVREHGPATRRVLWVGQRSLDLTRHPQPAEVQPIRILAGAFATDMPARDLLVSPRHALYVDGALFEAVSLINNVSIYQETVSHITYHHVELESHDVLLAEGMPAESFFDNGNKSMFAHQAGPIALHPLFPATGGAGLCAPMITGGDRLTALRDRLASRLPATARRAAA